MIIELEVVLINGNDHLNCRESIRSQAGFPDWNDYKKFGLHHGAELFVQDRSDFERNNEHKMKWFWIRKDEFDNKEYPRCKYFMVKTDENKKIQFICIE